MQCRPCAVVILVALIICATATAVPAAVAVEDSVLRPVEGDAVDIQSDRDPGGRLKVTIAVERYDGRRLIRALLTQLGGQRGSVWLRDADLDLQVGAFAGLRGELLERFSLQLSTSGAQLKSLTFTSPSHQGIAGALRVLGEERRVVDITAGDAGSLLRALDLYGRMTGGRLAVTIDLSGQKPDEWIGNMTIRDSVTLQEPGMRLLARIFGSAGDDLRISIMRMTFTLSSGQLAIRDGYICGSFGWAEIAGTVDPSDDRAHLAGTVDPSNNRGHLAGRFLPIFGHVIQGDLPAIAQPALVMSYDVTGSIRDPVMRINPFPMPATSAHRKLRSECFAATKG